MKTLRIVLMSLAVVIAVGAAVASTNSKRVLMWVSSDADGDPGTNANITLPENCATSNPGDPCTVASGTHAGKYIFDTDHVTRYRKPLP